MKVSEAVEWMTKSYLHRIIDSFTRDLPKTDEPRAREIIVRNVEELTDVDRIARVTRSEEPYSERILQNYILEALVNSPDHCGDEERIIDEVRALEEAVIAAAADPDSLRYEDDSAIEIFRAVLEVALEDEKISHVELNLIERLRQKLNLKPRTKRILLAQLNHFPRAGNRVHTPSEFRDSLTDLQRKGVVFYCNRLDGGCYVLPDEIVPGVRRAVGIELNRKAWALLLESLTRAQLATILGAAGLPKYGNKDALTERIIVAGIAPSQALDSLSNQDLYDALSALPGAKVSGTKAERVDRIIDYFGNLVVREVSEEAPPGERYYRYLVELAHRDRENLLANKVIKKDRNIEDAFEEGTRYLFAEKLGLQLIEMSGSERPDGGFAFGKHGDLLLWDNKSKETVYTFPNSHRRQFKRYIRDSKQRVSCFLVIVPEVGDGAEEMAARTKIETGTDTDVAIITAEDLLWVAEEWAKRGSGSFDPELFNTTGVLDRSLLERRMRLFL